MTSTTRIVGSMFGLEPLRARRRCAPPAFLESPHLLLSTARSAFTLLARELQPAQIWLPSYLCDVVLHGLDPATSRIRFYGVDERLRIEDERWHSEVGPGDFVVFIDYFGFTTWESHGVAMRERGAWVLEDACQAMLNSAFSSASHYVIVSPRKFVGVPDGGILVAQQGGTIPSVELADIPRDWWLDALTASMLRAEYDKYGGRRAEWFDLFRSTDRGAPIEPSKISELSSVILTSCIDFEEVAAVRRRNYNVLASALPRLALLPNCPAGVAPLGFPIRVGNRDEVRAALIENKIFPPIHWPLKDSVPVTYRASHRLAEDVLTIPCDQRCTFEDLERIILVLNESAVPIADNGLAER